MRRFLAVAMLCGLLSCAEDAPGDSMVVIAQSVTFGARTGDVVDGRDVSVGVDLDGLDTTMRAEGSCFQPDFISPDGRAGIDNQFTQLFELVESFFQAGTVEGIIKGTINEGRLLMMFEVEGVENWQNDDDVELTIFLGDGRPDIGGDDLIVPGQTFDRRQDAQEFRVRAEIVDGVLRSDPFDLSLPMAFFNVFFDLHLYDARIRAQVDEDGGWSGVIAGGMDNADIMSLAQRADMLQEIQVAPTLALLLPQWADLAYDPETGGCNRLSATLLFQSTLAFVFADAPADSTTEE